MNPNGPATSLAISSCRACGSSDISTVLDFGDQPAADHFPVKDDPCPDPLWPLAVVLCGACGLAQLGHHSPAEQQPRAVESATSTAHAATMAAEVVERLELPRGSTVLEYHSNHGGSWRSALLDLGMTPVSPTDTSSFGADLVIDNHSIVHAEEFAATLAVRLDAVAVSGHYVIEFHHLLRMINDSEFDTIRHGHPVYLTVQVLAQTLSRFGFIVLDVAEVDLYGGCVVLTAGRSGIPSPRVQELIDQEQLAELDSVRRWTEFSDAVHATGAGIKEWLTSLHSSGRSVLGYGAPSKAALLLSEAGVGPDLLPAVADLAPAKHGRRVSGSGVPIISPDDFRAAAPEFVLLLAWDIAKEVMSSFPDLVATGTRFFSPIPQLHELAPAAQRS